MVGDAFSAISALHAVTAGATGSDGGDDNNIATCTNKIREILGSQFLTYLTNTLNLRLQSGMEITGIASQFAMQSRPICDASSHMTIATHYCATARYYFSSLQPYTCQ